MVGMRSNQADRWRLQDTGGLLLFFIVFIILSAPQVTGLSDDCDNEKCGSLRVLFPFGLSSSGCGLGEFKLNCTGNSTLMVNLNNHEYQILAFTKNSSIIINPLSSPCLEAQFTFKIFEVAQTYAVSRNNVLFLYSCDKAPSCPNNCSSVNEYPKYPCGNISSSCCYDVSTLYHGFTSSNCKYFTSWYADFQEISTTEVNVQVNMGLELNWAIRGRCNSSVCHRNASCTNRPELSGFACSCAPGLVGDPYRNNSSGCRPDVCGETVTTGCLCPNGQLPSSNGCSQPSTSDKTRRNSIIAGTLCGATILSGVLIALAVVRRRYISARLRKASRHSGLDLKQIQELLTKNCNSRNIAIFAYKDLEKATEGFSETQLLGHGAHGLVYAGKLQDGSTVAVKRINKVSRKGMDHVVNELTALSSVKHRNLVQLLGCCLEVQDPLLVYEFVPNGTLAEHLQRQRGDGLDWITRISIATEAAQALAYLHSAITPPIYHRDVKSTNILLDFEYNTKVADFGLSKLVLTDDSHISTFPQGTPGYLDPDYHQNFILTDKSDVYSFGVVLVEIISGLKVVDFSRNEKQVNLAVLAVAKIGGGRIEEMIDPFLEERKQVRELIGRVGELAFRCLAFDKNARPSMVEVAEELVHIRCASMCAQDESPVKPFNEQDTCSILPR